MTRRERPTSSGLLAAAFAERAGIAPQHALRIEAPLLELVETAARAWPGVVLDRRAFARVLADRLPPGEPVAALGCLRGPDLFLACAAGEGDPAALRALLELVRKVSARASRTAGCEEQELAQRLMERLVAPAAGRAAPITCYKGRGPLIRWLQVTAARTALNLRRSELARRPGELEFSASRSFSGRPRDPELDFLRMTARQELSEALEGALGDLTPDQRELARLYFAEGMTTDAIGLLHGVNGSTIRRRLAQLRTRIVRDARKRLAEALRLSARGLDSLVAQVQSGLDLSLPRLLGKGRAR